MSYHPELPEDEPATLRRLVDLGIVSLGSKLESQDSLKEKKVSDWRAQQKRPLFQIAFVRVGFSLFLLGAEQNLFFRRRGKDK